MSIRFRVDDGFNPLTITPAIINSDQLGELCRLLAAESDRHQMALMFPEHGSPVEHSFSFSARVCPLSLASVSACFDHYPGVITVLEEAQFRGRRIWLGLSSDADAAPALEVSSQSGVAILEMLGLDGSETMGAIPLDELRRRLSDPSIYRRISNEPGLERYLPHLTEMARVKAFEGAPHLAWA
jgi:hypothetical protein